MDFFVIAPYNLDPLYEKKKEIVIKLAKSKDLCAYYASDFLSDGNLNIEKSIDLYKSIDFFIADLSYERPSCYFEVGFVQAMNKPVFLIALETTVIHQLLNKNTVRLYKDLSSYSNLLALIIEQIKK
jgi:hypothetical protein